MEIMKFGSIKKENFKHKVSQNPNHNSTWNWKHWFSDIRQEHITGDDNNTLAKTCLAQIF